MKKNLKKNGFTLIEMVLVIGLFMIVMSSTALVFSNFVVKQELNDNVQRLTHNLRKAQANALIRAKDSKWGVFFDDTEGQEKFVFFKGSSFGEDQDYDQVVELSKGVDFGSIALNGGSDEVVFNKETGETDDFGSIEIEDDNGSYTISINSLGQIEVN